MSFRDIFLLFIGIVLVGLSLLKVLPPSWSWVMYVGLASLIILGIRMIILGIKTEIAARPFRPSIEDLQYQQQKKEEAEARKKNGGNDIGKF